MNYFTIYDHLVKRGQTERNLEYFETHHIIPRCVGGTNDHENLTKLTAEEHYLAHQLLVRMYPDNKKFVFAANMMTVNRVHLNRSNNKVYGWLRQKIAENMKQNNPNAGGHKRREYVKKYGNPPRNWALTESGRQSISEKMKKNNPNAAGINNVSSVKLLDPLTKEVKYSYKTTKEAKEHPGWTSTYFNVVNTDRIWLDYIWQRDYTGNRRRNLKEQ